MCISSDTLHPLSCRDPTNKRERNQTREREREKWKGRQPNEKKTIEAIQTSVNVHTAPKPIQRMCIQKYQKYETLLYLN
jgi:hypothetical protein